MFSNVLVKTGSKWHERTRDKIGYSLENWSQKNIDISYVGGGGGNKNFEIKGDLSKKLQSLRIAKSRLYVTQNLARFAMKETDGAPAFKLLKIDHQQNLKKEFFLEQYNILKSLEKYLKIKYLHFSIFYLS